MSASELKLDLIQAIVASEDLVLLNEIKSFFEFKSNRNYCI